MYKNQFVSVIIPAMDEEKAVGKVIDALNALMHENQNVVDEIIVCDNASVDDTANVATQAGAKVIPEPTPGYGQACLTAITGVDKRCDILLFIDGDFSCYPEQGLPLLEYIYQGGDLAIGSRVLGQIQKGALTPTQLFGNWLSAKLIYMLYREKITDLGPFRAIRKTAYEQLAMRDTQFGWTVEMQVKAIKHKMNVREFAVDSIIRIGQSKISGTLKGSVKAGVGIITTIIKLYIKK